MGLPGSFEPIFLFGEGVKACGDKGHSEVSSVCGVSDAFQRASMHLPNHPSTHHSIYPTIHPSNHLPAHLSSRCNFL